MLDFCYLCRLREWVAKASDRKREKELKKRERLERRKAEPRHQFDDPDYVRQKMQVAEGLEDALQQGMPQYIILVLGFSIYLYCTGFNRCKFEQ